MARSRKKPIESKSDEPRTEEKPLETVRIRGKAEVLEERDEDIVIARIECTIEGTRVGREHRFGRAFRVRMDDGSSVDVDITHPDVTLVANEKLHKRWSKIEDNALWATTERDVTKQGDGFLEREIVPVDARIVIAGRVARPSDGGAPQLNSTGKRSLIFFATHAGADPVARLRRFRRNYWLSIVFLVASCGAITAAAVTLWPELPPERESSGD